ncbi:MAG: hypothetical protein MJB12_09255 [Firmicutes bacterium]|nr:hypothetical protein [Bacillota bacterium]
MTIPATGEGEKRHGSDLVIGDYTICGYMANSGQQGTSVLSGTGTREAMSVTSAAAPGVLMTASQPAGVFQVDKGATYDQPVHLAGEITGPVHNKVRYRVSINDVLIQSSTAWQVPPVSVEVSIGPEQLKVGDNAIAVDYEDEQGAAGQWSTIVVRKGVDSVYVSSAGSYPYEQSLLADGSNTALIKIPAVDVSQGYLKTVTLHMALVNGDDRTGTVKIAPITTDWNASAITPQNVPNIDVASAIEAEITNTTGLVTVDITSLAEAKAGKPVYGIALYATAYAIAIDAGTVESITDYYPTKLQRPTVVYGNKVRLAWDPVILGKPEAFEKTVIKRSSREDMSGAVVIGEIKEIDTLTLEDDTISAGTVYYTIEVHSAHFAYAGNQLDFDMEDAPQFGYAPEKAEFMDGVVRMKQFPAVTESLRAGDMLYDANAVEAIRGTIQLKGACGE